MLLRTDSERGAATIEHVGLVLIVAAILGGTLALVMAAPANDGARGLATAIERKIRCGAVGPGPCWRDPLTVAYGRGVGGAVRALAPKPVPRNRLLPVDFRQCRRESCATGPSRARLTSSNRRTTVFVEMRQATAGKPQAVVFWLYRPGQAWESFEHTLDKATIAAHAKTPLLETDVPRLVPLETLDARDHTRFTRTEEPPWRHRIESIHRIR